MRRCLVAALPLILALGGCNASAPTPEPSTPTPVAARPTPAVPTPSLPIARAVASPSASAVAQPSAVASAFVLQSSAFSDGGPLPADFTCDGGGQSPPLAWSGAPPTTGAYALIAQDMDNTSGAGNTPFVDWLVYNLPGRVTQFPAGAPPRPLLTNGAQQGMNGNQSIGYLSPCPDHGQPAHHIRFALSALDGYVTLETGANYDAVRAALAGHTLAEAHLTAVVQR